tara:strand:- start:1385 stop:2521 length:1137 start_codon:yes stop_codon:yes gene_type:complete
MAVLAWGTVFYGNTVYLPALKAEHGWSTSLIGNAIALFFWLAIPVTLLFGWIADRFGTRLPVAYGGLAIGAGVAAMGHLTEPWHLYAAYALIATGYPLIATPAISASLVPWFGARLGLPLSLALTGASLGGALAVPAMVGASSVYGFSATVTAVGLLVTLTIVPLALFVLRRPLAAQGKAVALETSFTARAALGTSRFWRIAIAGGLGLGAQVGYLSHQLAYLSELLPAADAAYAISLGVGVGAIGRLAAGYLATRLPVAWLAAATYILQGTGIAILYAATDIAAIYLGSAVAGLVIGNVVMLPPLLLRQAFGPAAYGKVYGFANIALYVGAGFGSGLAGWLRDSTGAYGPALLTFVAFDAAAAIILLLPGMRGRSSL